MRRFNITVNGVAYDVEVEEITGGQTTIPVVKNAAVPVQQVKPAEKPAAAPVSGGEAVKAPMPGTILSVKVSVGDTVKAGQPVCVLEAMKMENEIPAGKDGKIVQILVSKGATVDVGTPLVVIG